ncbi:DUF2163 domain-containing protein [Shimia sp.]|uniref:DUF2163 domain-containing protein n=1 Tax=Shimia sp. TaxID=1954381 RepID=UPI00329898A9
MALQEALSAHLETGLTTVVRAWGITRTDGVTYGFTDHDRDLAFEGFKFKADSGLTAMSLEQTSGLSIDNTEALGVLSDLAVSEQDIEAGRFDGAKVVAWLVNWADVSMRSVLFRGTVGEIRRAGGAFRAELRGLSETLNQPTGRVFQKPCTAVLGDTACGFSVDAGGYSHQLQLAEIEENRVFYWPELDDFEPGWFTKGVLSVLTGLSAGLSGAIKRDYVDDDGRRVLELWEPVRASVAVGDTVKLLAGCDKSFSTCRLKFGNLTNFQGFPDIPGEGWTASYPSQDGENTGGSLR